MLFIPTFFYLLFGWPMENFWLLSSKQSHSPNVNHCIWAISFWPRAGLGRVKPLSLTECLVSFDQCHNTPSCRKYSSKTLNSIFSKCGNVPNTKSRYCLTLWWLLALQNTSMDGKFRVQNFSFLLINQ